MFLRKLTVIALPLMALALVLALWGPAQGLGVWGVALLAMLGGAMLSLLPLLAGERRGGIPFRRQLFVPAALLAVLIVTQGIAVGGGETWLPGALAAPDTVTVVLEGTLCGALLGCAIRG